MFRLSRQLERKIRKKLFTHWEELSADYYNNNRIGDLMSHAINDVNVLREVAMAGIFMAMEAAFLIVVTVILMSNSIHLGLTLLVLLPLPGLTYLAYKFNDQIHRHSTDVQEAISQLTSRVQQFIAGIRVVKAYVQEDAELEKLMNDNKHNANMNRRLIRSNSLFTSVTQGIVGLSYLISVIFGGILVMKDVINLGQFVAFNTFLTLLIGPVENLGRVINVFQRGRTADVRLQAILSEQPTVHNNNNINSNISIQGKIMLNNLTFTYPGGHKPVLKNINLLVPEGSSLGIIGKVGSGKTTLINLLLRVYNPPHGTIMIDGFDIHKIPLKVLRQSIGYVPQDVFLFSTPISENIAFDPHPYDMNEVENASKLAEVYENIVELSQEFDTSLGERGISLSGGQRQRLSMARALIKQPAILIFDDSLSAVDTETEARIIKNLKEVMKGRTTIIISHRISAVQHFDQIIMMEEGEIIEQGNHEALLRLNGVYAGMYKHQLDNHTLSDDVSLESVDVRIPGRLA